MRLRAHNRLLPLLLLSAFGFAQDPPAGGLRHARLYEVASSKMLNNVNRSDAQAALKVWAELMGQQKGFLLDTKVDIVDTIAELIARLESRSVDVMAICVTEFLELEARRLAMPVFTNGRGIHGDAPYSYMLVVKGSTAATSLAELRGKNILVSSRTLENAGIAWLEVMLGKERLGRASSFFASMKITDKSQGCILPVFFGTADACIVDEVNLDLAKEMNPQLGQLKVLARSRPMIENIVAVPVGSFPYRKEWREAMLSAQRDPRGRQILMVFKTERVVPVQPADLDSARELWREYFRLPGSMPNKTPVAAGTIGVVPAR
jgi:ABC-type phosphate/phosphonate transport system substrate-binding protein